MSESRIIIPGRAGHKLLTLKQAGQFHPKYRPIKDKFLDKVKSGYYIVLAVAAPAYPDMAPEMLWAKVVQRHGAKFVGEIRNEPRRSQYHGVKFLQTIEFEKKHIINIRMEDITGVNLEKLAEREREEILKQFAAEMGSP